MTKTELIDRIAERSGLSKTASEKMLGAFLDAVKDGLLNKGRLSLTGFGTFAVENRNERQGRNPRTGATITIPACKVIKFRPGKKLKDTMK